MDLFVGFRFPFVLRLILREETVRHICDPSITAVKDSGCAHSICISFHPPLPTPQPDADDAASGL